MKLRDQVDLCAYGRDDEDDDDDDIDDGNESVNGYDVDEGNRNKFIFAEISKSLK